MHCNSAGHAFWNSSRGTDATVKIAGIIKRNRMLNKVIALESCESMWGHDYFGGMFRSCEIKKSGGYEWGRKKTRQSHLELYLLVKHHFWGEIQ